MHAYLGRFPDPAFTAFPLNSGGAAAKWRRGANAASHAGRKNCTRAASSRQVDFNGSRVRSSLVSRRQREALTSNKIRVQRLINNITQNLPSTAVTGFWLFPVLRLHSAHFSAAHLSSALSPISHRAGSLSTRRLILFIKNGLSNT